MLIVTVTAEATDTGQGMDMEAGEWLSFLLPFRSSRCTLRRLPVKTAVMNASCQHAAGMPGETDGAGMKSSGTAKGSAIDPPVMRIQRRDALTLQCAPLRPPQSGR